MSSVNAEPRAMVVAVLPGPNRKRVESMYQYRLVYRNPEAGAEGCVMLWHVTGGRDSYQVALERDWRRMLHWHCTCADHIYRGARDARHVCKHIRGVRELMPALDDVVSDAA